MGGGFHASIGTCLKWCVDYQKISLRTQPQLWPFQCYRLLQFNAVSPIVGASISRCETLLDDDSHHKTACSQSVHIGTMQGVYLPG